MNSVNLSASSANKRKKNTPSNDMMGGTKSRKRVKPTQTVCVNGNLKLTKDFDPLQLKIDKFEDDPISATILWYLNGGYGNYCALNQFHTEILKNEQEMEEQIIREIDNQKVTDQNADQLIKKFMQQHDYVGENIYSCASCGIRYPGNEEKYHKWKLEDLPSCLQFIEGNNYAFENIILDKTEISIPINEKGDIGIVKPRDVLALYTYVDQYGNEKLYHLHPELVNQKEQIIYVCGTCNNDLIKNKKPKFSIANGVDFGNYDRIGLTKPNVHERCILALLRFFSHFVKITPNMGNQQTNYTQCRIQGHCILFPHDAPKEIGKDFCKTVDKLKQHIKHCLYIHFVDPTGKPDQMIRSTLSATTILARSYVVYQWLKVLKSINPLYSNLDMPMAYPEFKQVVDECKEEMICNATCADDAEEINFELGIGSDVAQVRAKHNESVYENVDITAESELNDTTSSKDNDNVPIQYNYLLNKVNCYTDKKTIDLKNQNILLKAKEIFNFTDVPNESSVTMNVETCQTEGRYSFFFKEFK